MFNPRLGPIVVMSALAVAGMDASAAASRLSIQVLPVHVEMDVYGPESETGAVGKAVPPVGALADGLARVHEGMSLLGIEGDRYDVRVLRRTPRRISCTPQWDGALGAGLVCDTTLDFDTMVTWGFDRSEGRYQGTVVLALLLFPDHPSFQWGGPEVYWGVNNWWSWTGFEPDDLHWTTTSCAIWSVPWSRVLAHELGHCFGLYHTESDVEVDPNGTDSRFDLMTSTEQGGNLSMTWLKPSNARRVQMHFAEKDSQASMVETGQRGPTVLE